MALSGTVAFKPNVEEIIAEAFERCGLDTQTQTGDRAVSARRSLNLLFLNGLIEVLTIGL